MVALARMVLVVRVALVVVLGRSRVLRWRVLVVLEVRGRLRVGRVVWVVRRRRRGWGIRRWVVPAVLVVMRSMVMGLRLVVLVVVVVRGFPLMVWGSVGVVVRVGMPAVAGVWVGLMVVLVVWVVVVRVLRVWAVLAVGLTRWGREIRRLVGAAGRVGWVCWVVRVVLAARVGRRRVARVWRSVVTVVTAVSVGRVRMLMMRN